MERLRLQNWAASVRSLIDRSAAAPKELLSGDTITCSQQHRRKITIMEPPSFFLLCFLHKPQVETAQWMEGSECSILLRHWLGCMLHHVDNWGSCIDILFGCDEGKSPLLTVNGSEWRRTFLMLRREPTSCRRSCRWSLACKEISPKKIWAIREDLVPQFKLFFWETGWVKVKQEALSLPKCLSHYFHCRSWARATINKINKTRRIAALLRGRRPAESSQCISSYQSAETQSCCGIKTKATNVFLSSDGVKHWRLDSRCLCTFGVMITYYVSCLDLNGDIFSFDLNRVISAALMHFDAVSLTKRSNTIYISNLTFPFVK